MTTAAPIPALNPRGRGHRFVFYGDACSGVPGALHEQTFAATNAVVRRIAPPPEFVIFPGDEVIGLTADPDQLRAQWRHWLDHEMAWLDRKATPVWHTTSNHTTYDTMSEAVFREMLALPLNGPTGQEGLSYWVRREDLLMVFVHTCWSGLEGEGHVETDWLHAILQQHADARHKLVIGHHPVFPINGFTGPYQREIGPEHGPVFWNILVEAGVMAYLCSHILAFDVQVHRGVLQVCSAGAGTAHRMPEGIEYLHCVQAALDRDGLRYQVLDATGAIRERLSWPPPAIPDASWRRLAHGTSAAALTGKMPPGELLALQVSGRTASSPGTAQTLFSAFSPGTLAPFWLGLTGPKQKLTAVIGRAPGRSPHYWHGPSLAANARFDLHLLVHPEMGPGGLLYRCGDAEPWSSFTAASPTGPETLVWPEYWSAGHAQGGPDDRPFLGSDLSIATAVA